MAAFGKEFIASSLCREIMNLKSYAVILLLALVPLSGCTVETDDMLGGERIVSDLSAVDISKGGGHACAITDNGSIICWGWNHRGQLGTGSSGDPDKDSEGLPTPTPTASLGEGRTAISISAGRIHTCALLDDGSVSCWGDNYDGQVGDNSTTNRYVPTPISSLGDGRTAVAISSGGWHTCAILDDGSVSCWGQNSNGQLGDGSDDERNVPTPISSLGDGRTAVAISSGAHHTCAILDDGSVSCWGQNSNGQLGDGSYDERNVPTPISSLGDGRTAVAISAGDSHTCAILDDGSVSCWGSNWDGELGDGSSTQRNIPASTASLGEGRHAIEIEAGYYHSCAILDDGSVTCWGSASSQFDTTNLTSPTPAGDIRNGMKAIAISLDFGATCVILEDSTYSCWGDNYHGQLGDGTWRARTIQLA